MSEVKKQSNEDLLKAKQQMLYNEFYAKRTDDDLDIIKSVANLIEEQLGTRERDLFLSDPDVASMRDRKTGPQRAILNKYFTILLYRYRGLGGKEVLNILWTIFIDGTHEDWFESVTNFLIPFFKEYKVYDLVYPK